MPAVSTECDVVVVGAGVVGCGAARELAPEYDVTIVEKDNVATGATGKASGLISLVHDYTPKYDAIKYALEFFKEFDGTGQFSFTRRPSIGLVRPSEEAETKKLAKEVANAGFETNYFNASELNDRYPDVFDLDQFVAGVEFRNAGWVDPYDLTNTLLREAERAGATLKTGLEVEDFLIDGDTMVGVQTNDGKIRSDYVICAAGWRTRRLLEDLIEIPTRPFRYQTLNLTFDKELDRNFPIGWQSGSKLYWRPEHNGDLHVGGGPYFIQNSGDVRQNVTEAFRKLVATHVPRYLSGIEDARIVGGNTCPTGDAATPDRFPILDEPASGPKGLIVATGMHGLGIMAAPIAMKAVEVLVSGGNSPFDIDSFKLDRFGSKSTEFSSEYIKEDPAQWSPDELPIRP